MKAIYMLIVSVPMLIIAGITGYWAFTGSGWWLIGTAASLFLAPDLVFKKGDAA